MGLVYIEYISRRAGVDLASFHADATAGQEGWHDDYGEDRLILSAGRTWRLGPEPEYMAVWHTPDAGFERIDAWDRIFRSGDAETSEQPFFQVARIDVAGCYQPLLEPVQARHGTYYGEFFRATADLDTIGAFYAERAQGHPQCVLNLLLHRIGKLAPEPGGLAVWTLPDFSALAEIAAELDGVQQPVELVNAGTYADLGREIL